jgi:hypothetical protein
MRARARSRRARRARALAMRVAVVAACAVERARATREDAVGTKDFALERVGDARACVARLCASSDAIASVDAATGAIEWRVASEDAIETFAADAARGVATTTSGRADARGKTIRGYDLRDAPGALLWEDVSYGDAHESERAMREAETHARDAPDAAAGDGTTTTLARGEVVMRETRSGEVLWRAKVREAVVDVAWARVFVETTRETAYAVGRARDGGAPCAAAIRVADGSIIGAKCAGSKHAGVEGAFTIVSGEKKSSALARMANGKLVVVDVDALARGSALFGAATISSFPAHVYGDVDALEPLRGHDVRAQEAAQTHGFAVARAGDACALIRVEADTGAMRVVARYDDACPAFTSVHVRSGKGKFGLDAITIGVVRSNVVGEGVREYERFAISVADGATRRVGTSRRGDARARAGPPARAFFTSDDADAMIVVDEDATMTYHEGNVVRWTREEATSQAVQVIFGDLPEKTDAAGGVQFTKLSLRDRSELQLLALKARFQLAGPREMARLIHLRSADATKLLAKRDANGFRKSILTLSERGAIVALHNGDGRTLWRQYLGGKSVGTFKSLMKWKPIGGDDEVDYALAMAKSSTTTTFFVVNQFTGELFGKPTIVDVAAAHVLPFTLPTGEDALIVVDAEGRAATYPKRAEPSALDALNSLSYYKVDQTTNEVRGYKLRKASDGMTTMDSLHTWTVSFPPAAGSIVGFANKPTSEERVNSWTRVPGDRSTLFKYLNPNTIFVATSDGTAVHVSLIDGVTGRILYRVRHGDARGPVKAVVCENWVAYHYFNTRAKRYAMSVLEMFDDGEERRNLAVGDLLYDSILGKTRNETSSSLNPPPLRIIGQSYYVRPEAKMISVTRSKRGVTEPAVLLATANDQVAAIDKRFLDPRRPNKPSAADREEGLIPYTEVIPIFPGSWVTHKRVVHGLRGLVTAPAELESSIHFVAHGLDLFYARITPSQSFDALDDDFNYVLLVFTLVALAVGAFVTKRAADAADANHAWR